MKKDGISPAAISALAKGDLENFVVSATPGGIEAQEARGQRDFVRSETLPKDMRDARPILESFGVVFGDDADDLFVKVQLPSGWKKEVTDHSMWSHLLDDKGRQRAAIFYKAALYDRSAHLSLTTRFTYSPYAEAPARDDILVEIRDGGAVIHRIGPRSVPDGEKSYDVRDAMTSEALAWLTERYPDWQNPAAYWD